MKADPILEHILKVEGWPDYTNRRADRGGPTKGGITLATLQRWRLRQGRPRPGIPDLRDLSRDEALEIYRSVFVTEPRFGEIADDRLRLQVVDAGVLSGPPRAAAWLQAAAGATVDGQVGPQTLAAVNGAPAAAVGVAFAAIRIRFLGRLIEIDRSQAEHAAGWMNRATSFLDAEAARLRAGGA